MNYRQFGRLDWQASALGFGCMRLPTLDGDSAKIDEPEATRMVRFAIDQGVNYLDTAYPYHGGNSERFLGRALQDGYRQKIHLATKMPTWAVTETADFDRYLNEQLEKLQTDHIDFYLLHGLNKHRWAAMKSLGVTVWAEQAIRSGRIRYLGFSFHDEQPVFMQIVDDYDWTFCQIQYNYMDIEEQAGMKGLQYAASKGLAVVVMEPLLGGRLASSPDDVQRQWDSASVKRTPVEWALQWLWNQPEVSVVLSGMSTMPQVVENIECASRSGVGSLTSEELDVIDRVRAVYKGLCPIPCTKCGYCLPCPNGVNIPRNFEVFNKAIMINNLGQGRFRYNGMPADERAEHCEQCHECEEKCPQQIVISQWMPYVHEVLGLQKDYNPAWRPQRL